MKWRQIVTLYMLLINIIDVQRMSSVNHCLTEQKEEEEEEAEQRWLYIKYLKLYFLCALKTNYWLIGWLNQLDKSVNEYSKWYLVIFATKNRVVAREYCAVKAIIVRLVGHRCICLAANCGSPGPKSVRSGDGRPLIALRCLLLILDSTPLRFVSRCCSGFPVITAYKCPYL